MELKENKKQFTDLYLNQFNMTIEQQYEKAATTPSDINEHIPVIRKYASQCETVIECGVRACVSTWALLAASPKRYVGIDLHYHDNIGIAKEEAEKEGIEFIFIQGDSSKEELPESQFMLIDSFHSYQHLKNELAKHADKIKKYLIFHDTFSYKDRNEAGFWLTPEELANADNTNKGIWPAIEEFLQDNPQWSIAEHLTNNNGLTILKRLW